MYFYDTHCCGIKEIGMLSQHKTAEDAMVSFCTGQLETGVRYFSNDQDPGQVYTHYLFTAAVYPKDSAWNTRRYGHEFADFIRKNKLGKVIMSKQARNAAFHPDHDVVAWLWSPDIDKLRQWWKENKWTVKIEASRKNVDRFKEQLADYERRYAKDLEENPGGYYRDDINYYKRDIDKAEKALEKLLKEAAADGYREEPVVLPVAEELRADAEKELEAA